MFKTEAPLYGRNGLFNPWFRWADSLKAEGTRFNHPFLQALCMFFGEFLCLLVFFAIYAYKRFRWNRENVYGQSNLRKFID